jgi:hypothetical protein
MTALKALRGLTEWHDPSEDVCRDNVWNEEQCIINGQKPRKTRSRTADHHFGGEKTHLKSKLVNTDNDKIDKD